MGAPPLEKMTVLRLVKIFSAISLVGLVLFGLASAHPGNDLALASLDSRSTDLEPYSPYSQGFDLAERDFGWFDGITGAAVATGLAIIALSAGCVASAPLITVAGSVGCVAGVIGLALSSGALGMKIQKKMGGRYTIDGTDSSGILSFRDHIGKNGLAPGYIGAQHKSEHEWDADHNEAYQRVFNSSVEHYGWITKNDSIHGHLVPEGFQAWPIYEFRDPQGRKVHHVEFYDELGRYRRGRMWWPGEDDGEDLETTSLESMADGMRKRKDVPYRHKGHFKYGGLDAKVNYLKGDGKIPKKDLDHWVSIAKCYCTKAFQKKYGGLWSQTYNAKQKDTVACTGVAAVSKSGKSNIGHLKKCPAPVDTKHGCGKHYNS